MVAPLKQLRLLTSLASIAVVQCPAIPSNPLEVNSKLPDWITLAGGLPSCGGPQLVQTYESGTLSPKPQTLICLLSGNTVSVRISTGGKSTSFSASISFPAGSSGTVPAIINVGTFSSLPAPSSVAFISFNNDDTTSWKGQVLYAVGVTTCSRNSKSAIRTVALEPRIVLTIPQESGSGGAACWRISDDMKRNNQHNQTPSQIITENVWFSPTFNTFVNRVDDLPFDHHLLAALIAPPGLFVIEHSTILWLGPQSAFGCQVVGRKICQALGVPNNVGISSAAACERCQFPTTRRSEPDASANTDIQCRDWLHNMALSSPPRSTGGFRRYRR
ncbi:hypothetical protein BKA70DRAFT_1380606 [Coprinopsis sp. MPI-PUGE-AT-0042]|nr:hypothetical protein BKA70DRAFT_1380606 [Coprinopsis sp. MPI-PUGE-AT-0042]